MRCVMILAKIAVCVAAILVLKLVSCGPEVHAHALSHPSEHQQERSDRDVLESLSLSIPHWVEGLQELTRAEVEVPPTVALKLAHVAKNLGLAQDLVQQGLATQDSPRRALRLAQARAKIAISRAAMSQAETLSRESHADPSLSRALLRLGHRIDTDLSD